MKNSISIYRKKAGLSQLQLGQLCGWGDNSQGRVSHYESERRSISIEDLKIIKRVINAKGIDCSIDDLVATEEVDAA